MLTMLKTTTILFITSLLAVALSAQGSLETSAGKMKSLLGKEVKVNKESVQQSLTWESATPWKMMLEIKTNNGKKEVSERFQFNLADFNPYLVSRQSKDSYQGVSCRTEKNNNYIEHWEDGKQSGYTNDFLVYFNDVNDADAFAAAIKEAIPAAQDLFNKSIQLPEDFAGLMDVLVKSTGNIDVDGSQIVQLLTPDTKITDRATLEVTEAGKGKQDIQRFDFSWGDLNALDVSFKTSGNKVYVNFETRRNMRFVQTFKNGEMDGFDDGFKIYVKSPDDAKKLVKAAEKIIPLGEKAIQARLPKVTNFAAGIDLLNKQLSVFSTRNEKITQSFSNNCVSEFIVKTAPVKEGKSTETHYTFNWADINAGAIDLKISGNGATVRSTVQNKKDLVAIMQEGVLQKYTDNVEIEFGDVESARSAQQIITQLIPLCPQTAVTARDADWITGALADMPGLKSEMVVALKRKDAGNNCDWVLSVTNISDKKGGSEETWEFSLDRMDASQTEFEVSGKSITVKVPAKFNEKVIKYYKDGKQSFVNKVVIPVDTIEKAKTVAETMKAMMKGCSK